VLSVLFGVIAYLIGVGALFLLASYYNAKPVGYEGFYFAGTFTVTGPSERGETLVYERSYIWPSFKFFELLVVGTAAGAIGIKVARLRRRRSVLTPAVGLLVCIVAWLGCILYVL
jgi:hypothetical protein